MKTATHQRLPALLLLGVGVLLAAGSFWLVEISNRSSGGTAVQRERTEPDYFVDHFTYAKLDAKGRVAYVIEGEKMTHYPVDKHSLIEKPVLRNWFPDRPPTTLRAEQATVNGDRTVVKLMDKVILERAQARGGDALTITSDYMLVLPEKDIVTTDRRVEIRVGDARLSGVGMLANNATRELTLESSVSGFYPAPGKRRAP